MTRKVAVKRKQKVIDIYISFHARLLSLSHPRSKYESVRVFFNVFARPPT